MLVCSSRFYGSYVLDFFLYCTFLIYEIPHVFAHYRGRGQRGLNLALHESKEDALVACESPTIHASLR